jgi:hypothetical protein
MRLERKLDELIRRSVPDDIIAPIAAEFAGVFAHHSSTMSADLAKMASTVNDQVDKRTVAIQPGKHSAEQRTRRAVAQDVHALLSLHSGLPLERESLMLSGYAAAPDTILHLTTLVAALPDDALVLELGSGLSTVWMALAAHREGRGIRIVSIDHDEWWGAETAGALDRLGLRDVAEVRISPLAPLPGAAEGDVPWYGLGELDGLDDIHLLVVDGPPASTGRDARYPAVPCLADRLAAEARILLDDTDRPAERAIGERWLAELGAERDAVVERVLERTTVIRVGIRPPKQTEAPR